MALRIVELMFGLLLLLAGSIYVLRQMNASSQDDPDDADVKAVPRRKRGKRRA